MNTNPILETDADARHRAPRNAIWKRRWVRNTVGLVVAVGAFSAGIYLDVLRAPLFAQYFESRFPSHPIARGQTESVQGQDWSLAEVKTVTQIPRLREPLPEGAEVRTVRIGRTGPVSATGFGVCYAYLVDGDRRWKAETAYGTYWVKPPDDGTTPECYKPGPLEFSFLVPTNAAPKWVEILNSDGSLKARLDL